MARRMPRGGEAGPRRAVPNRPHEVGAPDAAAYSTVTDFARFRGLSTSVPRAHAV